MGDTLSALDAVFLELEELQPGALMTIGGVLVFDPLPGRRPPALEEVRARIDAGLPRLPRYRQRLSGERVGTLSWPRWVDDEDFEVEGHVRRAALPPPGDEDELCEWTAEFFSHPLDRSRPLWDTVLLEGLSGERWALATRVHHCLVDGVGSADLAAVFLDAEPDARALPSTPASFDSRTRSERGWSPSPPQALVQAGGAGARTAAAAVHAALHPADALEHSRALAELLIGDELLHGAPETSLGVPIGQARRYAVVRVALAACRAAGRQLDASVNDVLLAACAGGLRRLLIARREPLPQQGLRAMVPMNLREASERLALGNRVTSLFVELPVLEPDERERVRRIAESTRRLKRRGAARGATTLIDLASVSPPIVVRAALWRTAMLSRLFNLTITNVPGPQIPLYAFGGRLREIHPIVPLAAAHAVGVAIFSYNGQVVLGISADRRSVPDLDILAAGVQETLDVLTASGPPPQPGVPSAVG